MYLRWYDIIDLYLHGILELWTSLMFKCQQADPGTG